MTSHHCGMDVPPVSSKMGLFKTIMFNLEPGIGWFWDEPTSPARLGPTKNVCRKKKRQQNQTDFMFVWRNDSTIIQHDRILIQLYFENQTVLETSY